MLLLIDIGNTSTAYGIQGGGKIRKVGYSMSIEFPSIVHKLLRNNNTSPINHVVIASVFPEISQKVIKIASQKLGRSHIWEVGRNLKPRIRHNYRHIHKLGSDRLINIYGASRLYKPPLLILDFGTALTCDLVSKEGVFLGGLIVPGPEIAFNALWEKTALLPKLPFPKGKVSFLGTDTREGMKAGILQGYGAMTDGLVGRFKSQYGKKLRVIATGGLARTLRPYTSSINTVDPLLTLKSLYLAWKDAS